MSPLVRALTPFLVAAVLLIAGAWQAAHSEAERAGMAMLGAGLVAIGFSLADMVYRRGEDRPDYKNPATTPDDK